MEKKPLEGIKVVGFTWYVAGPQTTKTLAACGAEVISIEGRTRVDPQRTTGPYKDGESGVDRSGDFNQYNAGKMSIALNLADPKGIEIAKKLVSRADVVVENYAGGVMKRMGLGYEDLRKVKPDIIMLSACMQGQTGPHADHPGTGYQLTALSGFYYITGWPGEEPSPPDGPYPDYIVPRFSVLAILAALDYRRRTGKGQYLDLSQYENAIHFLSPLILDNVVNQRVATRVGNSSPYAAPHGVYRCRSENRWCGISVATDEEWKIMCWLMSETEWVQEERFSTLEGRKANKSELDMLMEEWTMERSPGEITNMLRRFNMPVRRLERGEVELAEDAEFAERAAVAMPHGAYSCKSEDRWCAIVVQTDEEWQSFCRVIGNPEWTKDAKFSTLKSRQENEEEMDRLIGEWTINFSAEEVMTRMQEAGVAAGILETGQDLMDKDAQLKYRGLFEELDHPEIGKYRAAGTAFKLSKSLTQLKSAPTLGEHNEYILKELLGMSDEEVVQLVIEGAVE
ncbi:MAG: CoA transferase [Dehalococcoidales bacterium]|nr:MAG: CoA transferase [Dehalococcoidales bacterium]